MNSQYFCIYIYILIHIYTHLYYFFYFIFISFYYFDFGVFHSSWATEKVHKWIFKWAARDESTKYRLLWAESITPK